MTLKPQEAIEAIEASSEEMERFAQDAQNSYSYAKVRFIYSRLQKMGPWKPSDFTMELFFEIDTLQSALAVEYARIFVSGSRKVSASKVPIQLRATHQEIMELRNKRYAHDDNHGSVANSVQLTVDDDRILVNPKIEMSMAIGAPSQWQDLFDWLGEYLLEQTTKQIERLKDKTGIDWVFPEGPPPEWI